MAYSQLQLAIVVGYGQSNENGTGVRFGVTTALTDNTTLSVRPTQLAGDPTMKNFGMAGMFDHLAAMLSRRGIHVHLDNQAIGGTGIVSGWFGRLTNYLSAASVTLGAWVLPATPNGFKYLAMTAGTTSATPPTWPTSAGSTVGDGGVTWKAFATTGKDVAGYVYMPGDDGYDPVSNIGGAARMGAVMTRIAKYKAAGFQVWNIIQGGQQDVSDNQSQADLSACWTKHVQLSLAAGADRVLLGVTPPNLGSANISDWGNVARPAASAGGRVPAGVGGRLITARTDALAAYSGNAKVQAGADLSVLNDNTITLDSGLHLGHTGHQIAGRMWRDQVISLGLV